MDKFTAVLEVGDTREDRREITVAEADTLRGLETACNTYLMERGLAYVALRLYENGKYAGVTSWEPDVVPNSDFGANKGTY